MKRGLLPALLVLLLPVCAWWACEVHHARKSNADGIETYRQYRESLPPPESVLKLRVGEGEFYALSGPVSVLLALSSGPPVYIFDSEGKLLDWTLDSGDDPRFSERWGALRGEEIPLAEFERMIGGLGDNGFLR